MKNLFYLITYTVLIVSFSSCKKDKDVDIWKEANINAYEEMKNNPEYKALETESGPTGVYYKVIKSGTGTEHPFQTSKVKILYKINYYDGTVFSSGTGGNDIPVEIAVYEELYSGIYTPRGFSFALQNMVIGDKWEIWVPYYLAYGAYGVQDYDYYYYESQTIIKGYTNLIYEVELISIILYPQ